MVFFLVALLLIVFYRMRIRLRGFNEDYLDKACTTSVNGIFVILVIFSHFSQYAEFGGIYDAPYLVIKEHLNQMVVATFLFYSGYGMMESIKRKGDIYVNRIPSKAGQLLFRTDMAVLLFLIIDSALEIEYPVSQKLLAFTTWTSVGNSNWYITAMLMIYASIFISFKIGNNLSQKYSVKIGLVLTLALTIACVYAQMKLDRPKYCYNTMIIAPLGMFYSEYKESIERLIMKSNIHYFVVVAITIGAYDMFFRYRWDYGIESYSVWAVAFIALVILITMKVRICNEVLQWFGKHIFSIYILQRIPMILLDYLGIVGAHKYISLIIVFALTAVISVGFEKIVDKITGMAHSLQ